MTEKRFEEQNLENHLNRIYDAKKGKVVFDEDIVDLLNALHEENEYLKQEIAKFKEWEKSIGNVNREDLDKVFKMSIYEIAEAFEYYRKRIKELEE